LGDSLTQTSFEGWGGLLADAYQRRADVLNRGLSGYNTRWFLRYAQDYGVWEELGDIRLITILFGANDASLEDQNPHAHVPLKEYGENMEQLIQNCRQHYPRAKIVVLTPPPVIHEQRLAFQKQRYGEKATGVLERTLEHTGKYAAECKSVAIKHDVSVVDLYNIMQQVEDFGRFFTDGLHFSKEGHSFVLTKLQETISKELPEVAVSKDPHTGQCNNSGSSCPGIPSSGPYHDHIDHSCFEKAFETKPK
jgi:lysophospholipase L1-like esterase